MNLVHTRPITLNTVQLITNVVYHCFWTTHHWITYSSMSSYTGVLQQHDKWATLILMRRVGDCTVYIPRRYYPFSGLTSQGTVSKHHCFSYKNAARTWQRRIVRFRRVEHSELKRRLYLKKREQNVDKLRWFDNALNNLAMHRVRKVAFELKCAQYVALNNTLVVCYKRGSHAYLVNRPPPTLFTGNFKSLLAQNTTMFIFIHRRLIARRDAICTRYPQPWSSRKRCHEWRSKPKQLMSSTLTLSRPFTPPTKDFVWKRWNPSALVTSFHGWLKHTLRNGFGVYASV